MGQLIFLLLLTFALICTLYGISEGVKIIQRGFARVLGIGRRSTLAQAAAPQMHLLPSSVAEQSQLSPAQRCLEELKDLHALRQKGALSEGEFDQLKRHVLATLTHAKQDAV